MPLRLSGPGQTISVEACGETFECRVLSVIERLTLAEAIQEIEPTLTGYTELIELIGKNITRIIGYDEEPKDILSRLVDQSDLVKVIQAVLNASSISGDAEKNSGSPSGSSPVTAPTAGSAEPQRPNPA